MNAIPGSRIDQLNLTQLHYITFSVFKDDGLICFCYTNLGRMERQQRENEASVTAVKNTVIELEARMCKGVYLWRITGYARHLENARDNVMRALRSPSFYTDVYGYKLCLRYV